MFDGPFDARTLGTYLVAATALVLAPGPGQAIVLGRSLSGGRMAGVLTSLGLNVGTLAHTLAAAFGLSAILATSAVAYSVVKLAGAAYLVLLGIKALRERPESAPASVEAVASGRQAFVRGIVTGILNPKVALFFLAFLPQFVHPEKGRVVLQFLVLGTLLGAIGFAWDVMLASAAGRLGGWMARNPKVALWRQRVTGGVFVALGLQLAWSKRP